MLQEQFKNLIDDLKTTHGENLASVVLYGSAATGEFEPNASDYNLLIALKRITPKDLREAQAPMREWKRLGHPLPVYFTTQELQDAADVFPIEFHQMEKARVVLFGDDPFGSLRISDEFLRHQTEYELRSKLLQLRRLYIPASVNTENLKSLMSDSLVSFTALFRAALILRGQNPPVRKTEIIIAIVRELKLEAKSFEKILSFRRKDAPAIGESELHEVFADYLVQIEKVIEAVDKIRKS